MRRRRDVRYKRNGFRSLAQVSRHIRAEIYPLYMRNTFLVKVYQVPRFVVDVLPRSINLRETTLKIDTRQRDHNKCLDILPALRSVVHREDIKVRFQCEGGDQELADRLTQACQQRSRWQAMICRVGHIYIIRDPVIMFKEKGLQEWKARTNITSQKFWAYLGFRTKAEKNGLLYL